MKKRDQAIKLKQTIRREPSAAETISFYDRCYAWGSSFLVHFLILFICSLIYLSLRPTEQGLVINNVMDDQSKQIQIDDRKLDQQDWNTDTDAPIAFLYAKTVLQDMQQQKAEQNKQQQQIIDNINPPDFTEPVIQMENNMSEMISNVQGALMQTVDDSGSVDQLTVEILRQLKQSKVLLIWMLDASESLTKRREEIVRRFDRVYEELEELNEQQDDVLLTDIYAFGASLTHMLPEPTSLRDKIQSAVRRIPVDQSGKENVFASVQAVANSYRKLERSGYRMMLVVLTDEAGDDTQFLESALQQMQKHRTPVYVIGPMAPFGRKQVTVKWVDEKQDQTFYLPIDRGPESALIEIPKLPSWIPQEKANVIRSGYGPYALSQLVRQSGGIYFVYDDNQIPGPQFNSYVMNDYIPDYITVKQMQFMQKKYPIRKLVWRTSLSIEKAKLPQPQIDYLSAGIQFEIRTSFKQLQQIYDRLCRSIEELEPVEAEIVREKSPRWQANYDLLMGQLLVRRIQLVNTLPLLNEMYEKPKVNKDYSSNAWKLSGKQATTLTDIAKGTQKNIQQQPDSGKLAKDLERAAKHLMRVLEKHPQTPWSYYADRELKWPLEFEWSETFVVPPAGSKLPWDKPPWRELTDEEKARLAAAKKKFARVEKQRKQKQDKTESKTKPPRIPKL